ncbi:MAG: DUF2065 domain-containing protein [Rhodobacter sp.]|nr:DUF2065 domain-containing protein [Rhodobacter sp.]MCY4169312.1 DUF2065 domain-containing protein [Rhodobacter sp.]MCY4240175.1 DUF2065 domain-containing protein [Rhodobacter sp.]
MATVVLAIGLVLCLEGLAFALAPARLEDLLRLLSRIPVDTRRAIGLGAMAIGVLLVWIAQRGLGGFGV